jgi:hypothetical protein
MHGAVSVDADDADIIVPLAALSSMTARTAPACMCNFGPMYFNFNYFRDVKFCEPCAYFGICGVFE